MLDRLGAKENPEFRTEEGDVLDGERARRARVRGGEADRPRQRAATEITSAIENDPDTEVKKRAVFALSQLPKDDGIPLLIKVAKTNQNPAVRKQAMFWLGQSKDARALEFFAEVLAK